MKIWIHNLDTLHLLIVFLAFCIGISLGIVIIEGFFDWLEVK